MSGHRWKVGDRARLRYVRGHHGPIGRTLKDVWKPGIVVSVIALERGINLNSNPYDCIVSYDGQPPGCPACVLFDQLEPIIERGSWDEIERATGWRPSKRRTVAP